ncbi:MAG: lactonase family protein [Chloroflexi bacterium]|nr:lactonase family protein [Chloroflexota bacterium]
MKGIKRLLRVAIISFFSVAMLLSTLVAGAGLRLVAAGSVGVVYILTNTSTNNEVAIFNRASDGTLIAAGSASTGGSGSGAGLGSQGALALGRNNKWLFAVNAGSNEISVFDVNANGLTLVNKVASGGIRPISLTVYKKLLYVLNAGDPGNISGFTIGKKGELTPIAGSIQPLSNNGAGSAPGPAQVSFDPRGELLVVTEKVSNKIDVYAVDEEGVAQPPTIYNSFGATPFGFAFTKRGDLIVSEAAAGALSSYSVSDDSFEVNSGSVTTHQGAPCWVAVTKNGKFAYTTNAQSGSISGFRVAKDGLLSLLTPDGRTGVSGDNSSPIDLALSTDSQYLYVLTAGTHGISAFAVQPDGSLTPLAGVSDLPASAVGLAAR